MDSQSTWFECTHYGGNIKLTALLNRNFAVLPNAIGNSCQMMHNKTDRLAYENFERRQRIDATRFEQNRADMQDCFTQ
jgi:hypothetical protein